MRSRPVETVLSGPAASQAGAAFLAGAKTALVSDIGGTTTDIAYLRDGAPALNGDGAYVGGWRTMVEAADIRTSGLGGDSETLPLSRGLQKGLSLGPRRAIPLSLRATGLRRSPILKRSFPILCRKPQMGVSLPR